MSREQFEAWWEINYHNGNPPRFGWDAYREDGGYKIDDDESELDAMWNAWQAATNATEAKCAALAAENAGMKSAIDTTIGWQQSTDPENVESVRMLVDIKIPATNAFLAEVRAQGVDIAIAELNQLAQRSEKEAPIAAEHHRSAALYLQLFAAQLRQEAAK